MLKKTFSTRGYIYSKFSIRNHTTHFLNFYKKKVPKDENELFSNFSHDRNYE
jgi:hypothetical protein